MDPSLDRTPRDGPRLPLLSHFLDSLTRCMTDTSLHRTPKVGPYRSPVIFFVSLKDGHLSRQHTSIIFFFGLYTMNTSQDRTPRVGSLPFFSHFLYKNLYKTDTSLNRKPGAGACVRHFLRLSVRCIPYYKYKLGEKNVNIILTVIIMNKFACESRLDKPFPPNVYNTLSLKKGRLEENHSPTSLK